MKSLIVEIQYFGNICFYNKVVNSTHILFEQYENFQKMSFRNRTQVLGANGVVDLTVPVLGGRNQKTNIREIKIDYLQDWQTRHWRTLESSYNKSPYFLFYKDRIKTLYEKKYVYLMELNIEIFDVLTKCLKIDIEVDFTQCWQKTYTNSEVEDCRNMIKPANRSQFSHPKYFQVFDSEFEPNLSILDLLFNLGPEAKDYLST